MIEDDVLRLDVIDFKDRYHWRWQLTDAKGKFLADHEVSLNTSDVWHPNETALKKPSE